MANGAGHNFFSSAAALQDYLLQEAGPGTLVIVPHQRLAQQLWQRQRRAQLQAGRARLGTPAPKNLPRLAARPFSRPLA